LVVGCISISIDICYDYGYIVIVNSKFELIYNRCESGITLLGSIRCAGGGGASDLSCAAIGATVAASIARPTAIPPAFGTIVFTASAILPFIDSFTFVSLSLLVLTP
jgi:hypothetical protein